MLKSIITTRIQSFNGSEDGATLIEYGIALTLAVTIGTSAMMGWGDSIDVEVPVLEASRATDVSTT